MSERTSVYLKDRRTGELVEAFLIDGLTKEEVERTEALWSPFLSNQLRRMKGEGVPEHEMPQHAHWDWRAKKAGTENYLSFRMFGVECEAEMQGLMLVLTDGKYSQIPSQRGHPLVYVDYLAAAPWNLPSIVPEPRYAHVGSVLLATAITVSREEEYKGRIGLHSLPQSEGWYLKACGMTLVGQDHQYQNLKYFEMTPEQASKFIGGGES
jgi:hypothetical protein